MPIIVEANGSQKRSIGVCVAESQISFVTISTRFRNSGSWREARLLQFAIPLLVFVRCPGQAPKSTHWYTGYRDFGNDNLDNKLDNRSWRNTRCLSHHFPVLFPCSMNRIRNAEPPCIKRQNQLQNPEWRGSHCRSCLAGLLIYLIASDELSGGLDSWSTAGQLAGRTQQETITS